MDNQTKNWKRRGRTALEMNVIFLNERTKVLDNSCCVKYYMVKDFVLCPARKQIVRSIPRTAGYEI